MTFRLWISGLHFPTFLKFFSKLSNCPPCSCSIYQFKKFRTCCRIEQYWQNIPHAAVRCFLLKAAHVKPFFILHLSFPLKTEREAMGARASIVNTTDHIWAIVQMSLTFSLLKAGFWATSLRNNWHYVPIEELISFRLNKAALLFQSMHQLNWPWISSCYRNRYYKLRKLNNSLKSHSKNARIFISYENVETPTVSPKYTYLKYEESDQKRWMNAKEKTDRRDHPKQ